MVNFAASSTEHVNMSLTPLVDRHASTLAAAAEANRTRTFFAHWPEPPSGKIYGENANADGEAAFNAQINTPFVRLLQGASADAVGEELSPYGFPLGITYPYSDVDTLVMRANHAKVTWATLAPVERAALLVEALERASKHFFEIGYATQHTTGQGFVMAFQASGPHAFDRALEAVSMALEAQTACVPMVTWTKPMGKISVSIDKSYIIRPKGINLVIGCSTFPVWNTVPGMFAGLATGNPVIVKSHPGATYPIAIMVAEVQRALAEAGVDPHVVQLAVDTVASPIGLDLVRHPDVRIIDYTGGPVFGATVEREALPLGKTVFTEKAGVNCVVLESVNDARAAFDNLAFALSLYSGQMCTAPQNIFVPATGVKVADGTVLMPADVAGLLAERIDALVNNEKAGPSTLGAIQNENTAARIADAMDVGFEVIRPSAFVAQPGFEQARSMSPLVLWAPSDRADIYEHEWFGPVSFMVVTESFDDAIERVASSVRAHGALTALVYTTDERKQDAAVEALVDAGAPVAFNFDSYVWVNQSAAFSDFHGAGANPAGNATFADMQFVAGRFNVIGIRKQA
jgi:phenylacetic acid degradation protein paaN